MPKAIKKNGKKAGGLQKRRLKMTLDEINVLGNLFNTTYGRSGTNNSPTCSITATLDGGNVIIKYVSVFSMIDNQTNRRLIEIERENCIKLVKSFKSEVSRAFKKQCGRPLKFNEVDLSDLVEPLEFRPQGVPSRAYFKQTCICELL